MFHHRNRHINTQQKRLIRLLALLSVRTYLVFAPRAVPRYSCCTHPGMKRLGIFFHTYLGYKTSRVDEEHENSGTSCKRGEAHTWHELQILACSSWPLQEKRGDAALGLLWGSLGLVGMGFTGEGWGWVGS